VTAVAQWLRYCATNHKVTGSNPDGVIGIFHWHKSFWSHYSPEVDSASNRNEYQEYFLGVNAAGAYGWQPYHHPVPLSRNLGTLTSWNPLGHSRPVTRLLYLLYPFWYFCFSSISYRVALPLTRNLKWWNYASISSTGDFGEPHILLKFYLMFCHWQLLLQKKILSIIYVSGQLIVNEWHALHHILMGKEQPN
jgi:hypothetical protein